MYAMLNLRSSSHLLQHDFLDLSSRTLEACEILGEVPERSNESDERFEGWYLREKTKGTRIISPLNEKSEII